METFQLTTDDILRSCRSKVTLNASDGVFYNWKRQNHDVGGAAWQDGP